MNRTVWRSVDGAAYTPDEQHTDPALYAPRVTSRQSAQSVRRSRAYTYGQSNPLLRPVVPAGF